MKRSGSLTRRTRLRARGPKYAERHARTVARKRDRKATEFARIYHSQERVDWVKTLPCAACGVVGFSVNAHVTDDGTKGTGRKSGYACIAPLCKSRITERYKATRGVLVGVTGCHEKSHWSGLAAIGWTQDTADLAALETEAAWRARPHREEGER